MDHDDPIPINPGGTVDPAHVVGRQEDLAVVLTALGRGHGVSLTGERRHGKTAFSALVEREGRERGWTVISRSVEGTRTVDDVIAVLAGDLVAALSGMAQAAAWLKQRAQIKAGPLSVAPRGLTLDELLTEACEQASRLVLILDELPICAREIERSDPGAGSTFLHSLRRLRYDNEPKLTMLCLGSIGFHHVVPHLGGAINDLEKHPLMPLAEPFADELAARLLHSTPIPAVTREGLAPALARASEGVPYYLHHLADGCDRRHAAGRMLSPEVPGEILDEAITSSDDPWDLKHYVTRLPAYYGDEAPFAGALLDVIAVQPCDLGALRDALDSDPRDFSGYELGGILSRLEQDHYLQLQQSGTHRFRSDIVRRAWLRWRR